MIRDTSIRTTRNSFLDKSSPIAPNKVINSRDSILKEERVLAKRYNVPLKEVNSSLSDRFKEDSIKKPVVIPVSPPKMPILVDASKPIQAVTEEKMPVVVKSSKVVSEVKPKMFVRQDSRRILSATKQDRQEVLSDRSDKSREDVSSVRMQRNEDVKSVFNKTFVIQLAVGLIASFLLYKFINRKKKR